MATPKEQHDARPNARNTGPTHHRAAPADAIVYKDGAESPRPERSREQAPRVDPSADADARA